MTSILAASIVLVVAFAAARGYSLGHILVEALGPALMLAVAVLPQAGRPIRSSLSSVALMLLASIAVHLSGGAIEAHFLFFMLVPVVAGLFAAACLGSIVNWRLHEVAREVGLQLEHERADWPAPGTRRWSVRAPSRSSWRL